jgi:8-oxo-dGTP pyrophosphatase MutT (NUDIX family)
MKIDSTRPGGIVVNKNRICLVKQPGGTWCAPKGGMDEGENNEHAARREIREETGLGELKLEKDLGSFVRKSFTSEKFYRIHLFLFTTEQTKLDPEEDDHHAKWFDFDEAVETLTSTEEKEFFLLHKKEIEAVMG